MNSREGNLAVRTKGWIRMGLESRIKDAWVPENRDGMEEEE